jgi:hypothetical protein
MQSIKIYKMHDKRNLIFLRSEKIPDIYICVLVNQQEVHQIITIEKNQASMLSSLQKALDVLGP